MLSDEKRKELEAAGKLSKGNVLILKPGIDPPKEEVNEVAELAKRMDKIQEQSVQMLEKFTESIDKIKDRKLDIPRDKELSEVVKKLPGMVKTITNTTNKQYTSLFKELIEIVKTDKTITIENQNKPKAYNSIVKEREWDPKSKQSLIKRVKHKPVEE